MRARHRLRRARDIVRVRKAPIREESTLFRLAAARGCSDDSRIAFIVSRRLGSAVRRNRVRRRLRQAFESLITRPHPPLDIVVVARRTILDVPFATIAAEADEMMARCCARQSKIVA